MHGNFFARRFPTVNRRCEAHRTHLCKTGLIQQLHRKYNCKGCPAGMHEITPGKHIAYRLPNGSRRIGRGKSFAAAEPSGGFPGSAVGGGLSAPRGLFKTVGAAQAQVSEMPSLTASVFSNSSQPYDRRPRTVLKYVQRRRLFPAFECENWDRSSDRRECRECD